MNGNKGSGKPGGDLGSRVRAAQDRRKRGYGRRGAKSEEERLEQGRGISFAFRLGTELVAGLIVGVGAGMLFDWWAGTRPWLMILGFVLGSAAGMLNVYRTVQVAEQARRDGGGN